MNDYEFFAFDADGTLAPQPFEVFTYPMGDVTVGAHSIDNRAGLQVLWIHTPAPDWTVVFNWATLVQSFDHRVLVMPYLPSARGDKDTPSPARTNATLAAMSGITDIVTIDPHSPVWLDCLRSANPAVDCWQLDLAAVVRDATSDSDYRGVIAPDTGATARAAHVAAALGLPVAVAAKKRDPATGRILGYTAPEAVREQPGRYLVVDDICDGGATFALLATSLDDSAELDLWVTHGGFTKGPDELLRRYRTVHTTDSLRSAIAAGTQCPDSRLRIHSLRGPITTTLAHIADTESHTR